MLNKFDQTEIVFIVLLLLLILLFLCEIIHMIKMAESVFPPDVSFLSYQDQVEAFDKAHIAFSKAVKDAFFLMFHFCHIRTSGGFLQGTHCLCQSSKICFFLMFHFFVISGPSGGFLQGTHCICQSSEKCSSTGMVITSSSFPRQVDHSPKCLLFCVCFN